MSYQPPDFPPTRPYGVPYPPPPPKSKTLPTVLITVGSLVSLVLVVCVVAAFGAIGGAGDRTTVRPPTAAGATPAHHDAKPTGKAAKKKDEPKTYDVAIGSMISLIREDGSSFEGRIRSVKTYMKACEDFSPDPRNGVFVVVDVVVEQKEGTGSVNPLDFTFVGDDGTTANALSAAFSGCDEPSLSSTNSLRAGPKRAGRIAFDATTAKGTVEWAPGGLGADPVGSWKVG